MQSPRVCRGTSHTKLRSHLYPTYTWYSSGITPAPKKQLPPVRAPDTHVPYIGYPTHQPRLLPPPKAHHLRSSTFLTHTLLLIPSQSLHCSRLCDCLESTCSPESMIDTASGVTHTGGQPTPFLCENPSHEALSRQESKPKWTFPQLTLSLLSFFLFS